MSAETLTAVIADIRDRLDGGVVSDLGRVEQGVVLPLLGALGWPVFDPTTVVRNHRVGDRTVSCALLGRHAEPAVLVEIESPGTAVPPAGSGHRHAFERIRVATNGAQWVLSFADANRSDPTEPFCSVDLLNSPGEEAARRFLRYLDRGAIVTGDALEAAAADQRVAQQSRRAAESLPEAWNQLVAPPGEPLLNLLASSVERLCGVRPARDATARFLKTLAGGTRIAPAVRRLEPGPAEPPALHGNASFTLFDRTLEFGTNADLLVGVFIALAERDSTFMNRFDAAQSGRKRVSRNLNDLRPGVLHEALPGGWRIDPHISPKRPVIERACKIAGIEYGRDLVVEFAQAHRTGPPDRSRPGEKVTQIGLIVRAIRSLRSARDPFVPLGDIYKQVGRDARVTGMAEVWEMSTLRNSIRGNINNNVVGGPRGDGLFHRDTSRKGRYALSEKGERVG